MRTNIILDDKLVNEARTLKIPVPNWGGAANDANGWGAQNVADAQWILDHTGERN